MRSHSATKAKQSLAGALFLAPALLVLAVFLGIPVITAIYVSFTNADMLTPHQWVGLENYSSILRSREFHNSLLITIRFVLSTSIPVLMGGLFLAVLVNGRFMGSQLFKVIIFIPVVLSEAVTALVWQIFLHPHGLLNDILSRMGLIDSYIRWFHTPEYALLGIVLFTIWKEVGYFMIIFLAGLQSIPKECYEAAEVDGANRLEQFLFITLPLLKPTTLFASIMALIRMLNVFTPFFVITRGGPFNTTEVLPLQIYDVAFRFMQIGKASALSIIMLIIVAICSGLLFRTGRYEEI